MITTQCRSCESKEFLEILSLGDLYLSDFLVEEKKPEAFPLNLLLCSDCYLVQLRETTPANLLYTERYGYRSGINQTMRKELEGIVQKGLATFQKLKKDTIVVDIGANDGTLLSYYPTHLFRVGFDPVKKFAKDSKKHANVIVSDYFNHSAYEKALGKKKAHIITAISCFYDLEEPNDFLASIKKILHKKGVFIIQQNYLVQMLEQMAFDNIVHEHLEYYSLLSLDNLLRRHNLEVFAVEMSPINGGSFRTFVGFIGEHEVSSSVKDLREKEKKMRLEEKAIYLDFAKRVQKNGKELRKFLEGVVKKGQKVYLYGASTRGNTLLQYYNLGKDLISAAVERNPEKWGKKIASLGIPIISEEQARKDNPEYMLVLPWFFKEEFLEREKEYLHRGGHFIFPLPKFEVV